MFSVSLKNPAMNCALLLIDLQQDFLASAELQPSAPTLVARGAELLAACRQRGLHIIHVWTTVDRTTNVRLPHWRASNRWACEAGTQGHETPRELRPLPGEEIVHKTGFNPFASGELEKILRAAKCDSVILCGVHLHACVRTAAVESLERDLHVEIAEDAVGSNDPIHAAATRRWLAARCVEFKSAAAIFPGGDQPASGNWLHRSPVQTDKILFEVRNAGWEEISAAANAAQNAWPDWRRTPLSQRRQILHAFAMRLESAADEFARQAAVDLGKPIRHAHEEIHRAAANVRDVIQRSAAAVPTREPAGWVRPEPIGVVGVITAWNNPVAIPVGKIAPALVYGNTVLWKPAPSATHISEALLRLFHECGVPADALRLVTGDHTVAQGVAADPRVSAVTLTGSLAAGHAVQELCARRIVPVQMELSGNNAAIVWRDADFAAAAEQVAWGAFAFGGQRCTANRRAIVHAADFEKFLAHVETAAARLPWGDPINPATEIGPLIHRGKCAELESLITLALRDGVASPVIYPHARHANETWVKSGAYAQPVIVGCDLPGHVLVQEETMSPLLVVQPAEDFDHALELCNGVRHGLLASLFSSAPELQQKFLKEARAGVLKFNSATAGVDVSLPFGGWKASGLGPPEHGAGDIHFYTRMQAVYGLDKL